MTATLRKELRKLADLDKVALVDEILTELDRPDPRIDRIWAAEARKRWSAFKAGRLGTVPYSRVMARYRGHED